MKLKRQYCPDSLAAGQPRCTHVEVIHTGKSADQKWSDKIVERGMVEGWITIDGDTLTIKTDSEPLQYRVLRRPGYFCKSTGEAISISDSAWLKFRLTNDSSLSRAAALAWLAANGKRPDDYDITTAYECVLRDDQHAKYRAVLNKGNAVAAHTLEG